MFEQWGFLLTEIWVLLVLAALIGLCAGWLIFGRQQDTASTPGKANKLRAELDQYRTVVAQQQAQVSELEQQLATCEAARAAAADTPDEGAKVVELPVATDKDAPAQGPATLDEPKDGQADDLKKIKGVGPKLERLCNMMGFWHFDQIANWTDADVAWVDENLQGFKGRVSRDDWVAQAKILAAGGDTAFSQKQTD